MVHAPRARGRQRRGRDRSGRRAHAVRPHRPARESGRHRRTRGARDRRVRRARQHLQPAGQSTGAIVPYAMLDHQLPFDRTNALWIVVKPRPNVTVSDAEEAVMVTLRRLRHLRPSQANSFDLLTQDQILDTFNKLTGVFFLVMIVLSAVALLVGGIGVMAI